MFRFISASFLQLPQPQAVATVAFFIFQIICKVLKVTESWKKLFERREVKFCPILKRGETAKRRVERDRGAAHGARDGDLVIAGLQD